MLVYDAVMTVAETDVVLARKSVTGLSLHSKARRIFIITARSNFGYFDGVRQRLPSVTLIDEDSVINGVDLAVMRTFVGEDPQRARKTGWYYQQFLKMAMALSEDVAEHCLIWDADTILLRPTEFFDEGGRMLVAPASEYHEPYFRTLERILGISRAVDFSFICEHQMVNRSIMREMIDVIKERSPNHSSWVWAILSQMEMEDFARGGFSEFETYGNYALLKHADRYQVRTLPFFRSGVFRYGVAASADSLYSLGKHFHWASFEKWQKVSRYVLLHRLKSSLAYMGARVGAVVTGKKNPLLEAVRLIGKEGKTVKES